MYVKSETTSNVSKDAYFPCQTMPVKLKVSLLKPRLTLFNVLICCMCYFAVLCYFALLCYFAVLC